MPKIYQLSPRSPKLSRYLVKPSDSFADQHKNQASVNTQINRSVCVLNPIKPESLMTGLDSTGKIFQLCLNTIEMQQVKINTEKIF